MDLSLKLGKRGGKPQKLNKKNAPQKRSINLAEIGVKKKNTPVAVAALVIVLVAAAVAAKFGIVDRVIAVEQARSELNTLRVQIAATTANINSYGELAEKYAHYTYSGMTEAELTRTDRVEVLNLMDRLVLPSNAVESWTLHDNLLTLNIKGKTMQELNLVTQTLEQDELVEYCTVTTVKDEDVKSAGDTVTAQMVIYLVPAEEVNW